MQISDFGMTSARSKEGERVGTIFWNAPELLDGRGASTATDVYAFAITMYEIFHPLNDNIYNNLNIYQVCLLITLTCIPLRSPFSSLTFSLAHYSLPFLFLSFPPFVVLTAQHRSCRV